MSENNEIVLPPDVHVVNTNDIEPIVVKAVTTVCSHQDMDVSAALFHMLIKNLCSTSSDTDIERLVNERNLQPWFRQIFFIGWIRCNSLCGPVRPAIIRLSVYY